jgi:hypothetical protein
VSNVQLARKLATPVSWSADEALALLERQRAVAVGVLIRIASSVTSPHVTNATFIMIISGGIVRIPFLLVERRQRKPKKKMKFFTDLQPFKFYLFILS